MIVVVSFFSACPARNTMFSELGIFFQLPLVSNLHSIGTSLRGLSSAAYVATKRANCFTARASVPFAWSWDSGQDFAGCLHAPAWTSSGVGHWVASLRGVFFQVLEITDNSKYNSNKVYQTTKMFKIGQWALHVHDLCQYIFWDMLEWSQFFVWLYMLCYSHVVFPHIFSCLHFSLLRGLFPLSLSDPSDCTHIRIPDIFSFKEKIFLNKDWKQTKNSVLNTYDIAHYYMYICTQEIFRNIPT